MGVDRLLVDRRCRLHERHLQIHDRLQGDKLPCHGGIHAAILLKHRVEPGRDDGLEDIPVHLACISLPDGNVVLDV